MYELRQTDRFRIWLCQQDESVRGRVANRTARVQSGLFGDCKSIGGGVSELRIDFGPGYRVYFTIRDRRIIFLLCGGDKKTQRRDIEIAREMAKEV